MDRPTALADARPEVVENATRPRSWAPTAAIALLVLFHIVANLVWLLQDGRTLYGDPGNHARVSLAIFDILRHSALNAPARIVDATTFWPPFSYLLSQPLYALFGVDADVTVFTTTLFFALAIAFVYVLGRRLYGVTAGLLAAFLFSFYPIVFMLSRTYYQDMALAAMTTLTFYLMLRSEAFSQRRASLFFGLSLGLTALTKQGFFTIVTVPLLIAVGMALAANDRAGWRELLAWRPRRRLDPHGADLARRLVNLALAFAIAALIAAPWYLKNVGLFFWQTGDVRTVANFEGKPFWWYLGKFDETLLIWPFVLAVVGLATALLHPKRNWLPLAWFVGVSVVYPLVTRQHMRHMLPVLPAVALLSAQWVVALHRVTLRRLLIGATMLFQLAMFFVMSWGAPQAWNQALNQPVQNDYLPFADASVERPQLIDPLAFLYYQYPPRPHRWPVDAILQRVFADVQSSGRAGQPVRLTLLSKIPDFEFSTFAYEAELARRLGRRGAADVDVEDAVTGDDYLADFFDTDYALVKEGYVGFYTYRPAVPLLRDAWIEGDEALRQRFTVLGTYALQDGTIAELIKRNGPPLAELPADQLGPIVGYLLTETPQSKQAQRLQQLVLDAGGQVPFTQAAQAAQPADPTAATLAQSQAEFDAGDLAAAEATLRAGLEQAGDPASLWIALGKLLAGQGRAGEAETAFQQAVQAAPERASAWIEQASYYEGLARAASSAEAGRYWQAVQAAYEQALALNPTLVRPYTGLAQVHRTRKEFPAAIDLYQRGLAAVPNDPWLTFGLAQTYNEAGDPQSGLPFYQQAVQLQPDNALFQAQLGNVAGRLKQWEPAAAAYTEALRLQPSYADDTNFMLAYGFVELKREQFAAAAELFQQVLARDPANVSARFSLGQALEGAGDTAGAIAAYRALTQQAPESDFARQAEARLEALQP